jgi:hypothetical protein
LKDIDEETKLFAAPGLFSTVAFRGSNKVGLKKNSTSTCRKGRAVQISETK